MTRRLPTKQPLSVGARGIHVLKYLEKLVHLRWPRTFEVAKRGVSYMILLLTVVLLLTPIPLSNVVLAIVISLISLAYVEQDGLFLSVGFVAAIILIGLGSAAVWGRSAPPLSALSSPLVEAYALTPAIRSRLALAYIVGYLW
jgi:hypothetical protein